MVAFSSSWNFINIFKVYNLDSCSSIGNFDIRTLLLFNDSKSSCCSILYLFSKRIM
uniref:Uncharacterized protein n=1 Tax=Arundo donax TaxID=35708 RepID=A0A0A9FY33_ARUDO